LPKTAPGRIEENKPVFNEKKQPILERSNAQVRFIK
jgi:hypothetical protein